MKKLPILYTLALLLSTSCQEIELSKPELVETGPLKEDTLNYSEEHSIEITAEVIAEEKAGPLPTEDEVEMQVSPKYPRQPDTTSNSPTPTPQPETKETPEPVAQGELPDIEFSSHKLIAAGAWHTCSIDQENNLWCWGSNIKHQVGLSDEILGIRVTKPVIAMTQVKEVVAGSSHTCALGLDGQISCWGANWEPVLDNNHIQSPNPFEVPERIESIDFAHSVTAGLYHNCAIVGSDRNVVCWGYGIDHDLFDPNNYTEEPEVIKDEAGQPLNNIASLTAGMGFTCALHASQKDIFCWGKNFVGHLYNQDHRLTSRDATPVIAMQNYVDHHDQKIISIAAGWRHICALMNTGQTLCWGNGGYGQLGDQIFGLQASYVQDPIAVGLDDLATSLDASYHTSCAITDQQATCWGALHPDLSFKRQADYQASLVDINLDHPIKDIAIGIRHICLLNDAHDVWCWGNNDDGQLGDGTLITRDEPTMVLF